jgi:thymidylate kinase
MTTQVDSIASDARWAPPPGTLALVLELREGLLCAAVRYCHWKSNDMLARSASGDNDLDLLVHRADYQRFLGVLARLGFRQGVAPGGREHPGVSHHYALDPGSGRLVHIHAHVMLVIGDDTTKNFRLPIEGAYLASVRADEVLPVPSADFELAVFVIRMMLKHATWDAVAMGNGRLGPGERRELAWLLERCDPVMTRAVVVEHLGGVGVDLWQRCLDSLRGQVGQLRRLRLGRAVVRALAPHSRRPWPADLALRVARRGMWGSRRYLLRWPVRKRLARAGATVAIVGGDGAGKSTAVEAVADWLGGTFVVHRTHLGKPRPSLLTLVVKGPMYVARRAGRLPQTAAAVDSRTATGSDFPGTAWAVWHALTARDRVRAYRRARRVADRGGIVVSDRWPLPQIKLMDGSRVSWILDRMDDPPWLAARLARAERRLYAQIAPPDVLVVLRVDPEVAVSRRFDEDAAYVRARNTEVFEIDWRDTNAVVVDATQSPEAVLSAIRAAVWKRL